MWIYVIIAAVGLGLSMEVVVRRVLFLTMVARVTIITMMSTHSQNQHPHCAQCHGAGGACVGDCDDGSGFDDCNGDDGGDGDNGNDGTFGVVDMCCAFASQGNLHESVDSKRRTEDAFSAAQTALHSMKQKAGVYRKVCCRSLLMIMLGSRVSCPWVSELTACTDPVFPL